MEFKNMFSFKDFVAESKKYSGLGLFKKDVNNIIYGMFEKPLNMIFEYDSEGFPTHVKFQIVENDYIVDYDKPLKPEFSKGVLSKREYTPILEFDNKSTMLNEDETSEYYIEFNIDKEKVDLSKIKDDEEETQEETEEIQDDEGLGGMF